MSALRGFVWKSASGLCRLACAGCSTHVAAGLGRPRVRSWAERTGSTGYSGQSGRPQSGRVRDTKMQVGSAMSLDARNVRICRIPHKTVKRHIFDGFALINYLLCTALKKPRNKAQDARGAGHGYSSPTMRRNCRRHFRRTLEILEPTVIIVQGIGVRKWMANALPLSEYRDLHETIEVGGRTIDLLTFSHPSAGGQFGFGGNSPHKAYLVGIVAPAIREFLSGNS